LCAETYAGFHENARYCSPISTIVFVKLVNIKFHENPFSRSRVIGLRADRWKGQRDMPKLMGAFL
jgi:hypothetical protein